MTPTHHLFPEPPPDPDVRDYLRSARVRCSACGFDLREAVEDVCPECGTRHHLEALKERAYRWQLAGNCTMLALGVVLAPWVALGRLWPGLAWLAVGVLLLGALQLTVAITLIRFRYRVAMLSDRTRLGIHLVCWIPAFALLVFALSG